MSSEDALIKKIMDAQVILLNKHKLPSLFTYNSKFGNIRFGSKLVMTKFAQDYDDDWQEAFDNDLDELMTLSPDEVYYDEQEWGNPVTFSKSGKLPLKLPADLDLMVYRELWSWISAEILKDYWKSGGKKKEVR